MQEFKFSTCTVRVHGSPDMEKVKVATTAYLKKVERIKKTQKQKGA